MPRVHESEAIGTAQILAAQVSDRGRAHVLVHRVSSPGLARGPATWFFTPDRGDAQVSIHWCSPGMAQLRVCFVSTYGEAGWIDPQHPLALRYFGVKRLPARPATQPPAVDDGDDAATGNRITGR